MIATEAAAEGINLQFCSLVINFLNTRNQADRRVYELLAEKLKLFDGVFGASDEILGIIGSGLDFERRILEIYQTCRDSASIGKAFDELQTKFAAVIDEKMGDTKRKLLENFDDEVRSRPRLSLNSGTVARTLSVSSVPWLENAAFSKPRFSGFPLSWLSDLSMPGLMI